MSPGPSPPRIRRVSAASERDPWPADRIAPNLWARGLKRACDFLLSACLLLLLSPVLLAGMLAVRLSGPGPIFFAQIRGGRCNRRFVTYKLRTMRGGRTPDPQEIVTLAHPEVTAVGRVLRRLKIDELPQLINVVNGDMALIGPRPTLTDQTDAYDAFERQRLLVRPGITGLAQVNGNTAIPWEERFFYDVYYVRHHGLLLDLGILLATLSVIIRGENALARPFAASPYAQRDPQVAARRA